PKKKEALPPGTIKPIATYSAPGGEMWAVFTSGRYGNPDDIWLARGSGGSWQDFLFTGRLFERRNRYYNGRMGGPQPGSCNLKVDGDKVTLSPPDPKAAAEEERLRKMFEGGNFGKVPQKEQQALSQKYSQLMSKENTNLKSPITLSL